MKRCPQCKTTYSDDTLNFCLEDGKWLIDDDAEPATAFLEAEPPTVLVSSTERQSLSAHRAAQPQESGAHRTAQPQDQAVKPSFDKRLVLAPIALVVIVLAGFAGYRYFGSAGDGQINSIAVLPFVNRSDDPDTDYLSDGLAESLIFRLTQLPGLKVSPTSSVMRYKGNETDVAKIAKELGVDAVMTGRLVKRGDNLNITVELVDARNNTSLWGEQYERKMSDLLATQRDIAAVITQKLQLKLSGQEKALTKQYTNSSEAYQLYLKGRFHFARRTEDDLNESIGLFQQAVKLDPNFALAFVGIAEANTSIPSYPYASPAECAPKAKAAVARALELDPELPEAHAVMGWITAFFDWDYPRAESEFKKALELDPNLAVSHYRYGWTFLSPLGRHEEAIAEMKKAMELEPLSIQQGANYASVLMYAGRLDEALVQARKTYELDKTHIGSQHWLCHALNANGRWDEAIALVLSIKAARSIDTGTLTGCLGYAYAKTGQREKALEVIAHSKETEKTKYIMNYWVAVQYAGLGDKDAAFAELEKSYKNRDWFLPRLKTDPFMEPLRGDPRYHDLLKRLNLPD